VKLRLHQKYADLDALAVSQAQGRYDENHDVAVTLISK